MLRWSNCRSFRLQSGQGPEIRPPDFRGRSNLVVWFTKACLSKSIPPVAAQHIRQCNKPLACFQIVPISVQLPLTQTGDGNGASSVQILETAYECLRGRTSAGFARLLLPPVHRKGATCAAGHATI